jgi:hypothetical protein
MLAITRNAQDTFTKEENDNEEGDGGHHPWVQGSIKGGEIAK